MIKWRRSFISPTRGSWRNLWKLDGRTVLSSQYPETMLLLALPKKGCSKLCEEVWQMPTIWTNHPSSSEGTYNHNQPLAILEMRDRLDWAHAHWARWNSIRYHCRWLLYRIDWGQTSYKDNQTQNNGLHLEINYLKICYINKCTLIIFV